MDFAEPNLPSVTAYELDPQLVRLLLTWATPLPAAPPQAHLPAASLGHTQATVLAQQFDQDILGDMGSAWSNFVGSGQIWALLIGIVLGYLMRGMTTY
jgi:hypothetical protein